MHSRPRSVLACLFACSLLLGAIQVNADDKSKPETKQIDPVTSAVASTVGGAAAALDAAAGGLLGADTAAKVVENKVIAADSAGKALAGTGALVDGLFTDKLGTLGTAHVAAGKILVDIVRAVNSLGIAATNIGVGVADTKLKALFAKINGEALAIGNVYTQLIGELGRAVGNSLGAVDTLATGGLAFLNPVGLGINALTSHLNALINFLQGLVDASVASPDKQALLAPFLGTLQAVKALLGALKVAFLGPAGGLLAPLDAAVTAASSVAGGAADAAAGVVGATANAVTGAAAGSAGNAASLVTTALGLINQLI